MDAMKLSKNCLDFTVCICVLVAVAGTGCVKGKQREQYELENFLAGVLQQYLALTEGPTNGVSITNLAQVFAVSDLSTAHRSHPYVLQERFREFGATAGFTNSIFEKYSVVTTGFMNRAIKKDLILVSTQPFTDLRGVEVRMAIWRAGERDYRSTVVEESSIDEMLQNNRLKLSAYQRMPPANPPPYFVPKPRLSWQAMEIRLREIARDIGIGSAWWFIPLVAIGICLSVALTALFFVLRATKKSHHCSR